MPTRPITLFDSAQQYNGLYVSGSPDKTPEQFLRRATGVHLTNNSVLRSRSGSTRISTQTAVHSLIRFGDVRYWAAGTTLYRNGVSILTGLNGNRLSFARMPPVSGIEDYLFITAGGILRKVHTSGTVTTWGIAPPTGTITAASAGESVKVVDTFDDHTSWPGTNVVSVSDETSVVAEGSSIRVTVAESEIGYVQKNITIDLADVGGGVSPDEDWIELWCGFTDVDDVNRIEVAFSLGSTTFTSAVFSRPVYIARTLPPYLHPSESQRRGVADFEDAFFNQARIIGRGYLFVPDEKIRLQESLAQTVLFPIQNALTQLRLPKSTFRRSGAIGSNDWADVQSVRLYVQANSIGNATVFFDRMRLHGRVGHQGTYYYKVSFRNTTTGHESNSVELESNDIDAESMARYPNAAREVINLSAIPVSADTQVNQRRIYRTIGNGTQFFLIGTIDNNSGTTFTDNVADYDGLDSSGNPLMQNIELRTDNARPLDTFRDILYDGAVAFWLDNTAGQRGRIYFSPAGRVESNDGFIDVSDDDNPLLKLALFNGVRYAFAESGLYRIDGTELYIARPVEHVPGVREANRFTVVTTPDGIIWQANDGIRIFDGARSQLIVDRQLGVLFRGESREGLPAFEGVVAAYGRSEYLISDTNTTLAINVSTGVTRSLGFGCTALFYEDDTDTWLAARSDGVYTIEQESLSADNGNAFSFDIKTPAFSLISLDGAHTERIYIDLATGLEQLTPTVHFSDTSTLTLPTIPPGTRQRIEYPIGRVSNYIAVELSGTIDSAVEIYKIEADIYIP